TRFDIQPAHENCHHKPEQGERESDPGPLQENQRKGGTGIGTDQKENGGQQNTFGIPWVQDQDQQERKPCQKSQDRDPASPGAENSARPGSLSNFISQGKSAVQKEKPEIKAEDKSWHKFHLSKKPSGNNLLWWLFTKNRLSISTYERPPSFAVS